MLRVVVMVFTRKSGIRRALCWLVLACAGAHCLAQEVQLSAEDKKQMDPFEAHSLGKADKCFDDKQYRAAAAGYDSFLLEFPNSRVLAYAVFRKARSIDLDNKRFEAVKNYNEVLDYFPNDVHYAAAALYHMGECYMQTGDPENAVKAWTEMVQDKDYSKHYLAASALNMLAENYIKQENFEKAMTYYEQVVTDFRAANPGAAVAAMWKVVEYRMKTKPDESRLRAFYIKADGFDQNPAKKIPDDLAGYLPYWDFIRKYVRQYGAQFNTLQAKQQDGFYKYWADVMQGKSPDVDDFQIDLIDFRYAYERDVQKRIERLDAQFVQYQKPGDNERIIKWLNLYMGNKDKINEYYSKLDLTKLGPASMEKLVLALVSQKEFSMALNAFDKMSFREMDDGAKTALMRRLWEPVRTGLSVSALERLSDSFTDKDLGAMELLRYYHWVQNATAGIPIAEKLTSNPSFASEAFFKMGDLQLGSGQYEKVILSYQRADSPPATLFQIVECYRRLGRLEKAIETLTEVENFFRKDGPRAALMKANLYRDAGLRENQIAALRAVMKKYPGSPESSAAHQDLEKLGIKMGGGVDSEE